MNKPARKAQIGSISTGTLRTDDLIEAFEAQLEYLGVPFEAFEETDKTEEQERNSVDDAENHLDYLTALLEEQSPAYCYFGTLDGDGADFGFWPSEDSIRDGIHDGDIMAIGDDWSKVPSDYSGYVYFVSDHGNASLYYRSADGKDTEIW